MVWGCFCQLHNLRRVCPCHGEQLDLQVRDARCCPDSRWPVIQASCSCQSFALTSQQPVLGGSSVETTLLHLRFTAINNPHQEPFIHCCWLQYCLRLRLFHKYKSSMFALSNQSLQGSVAPSILWLRSVSTPSLNWSIPTSIFIYPVLNCTRNDRNGLPLVTSGAVESRK